ncbi:hypothetical protein ACFC0M_06720 [Streptomyces sp. NPDC056149]|uniref:hypothetical protein n=1 Tax=Streptomyces sp. NPDC056149 TaxID=3345728 RepID=UPI0035E032BA
MDLLHHCRASGRRGALPKGTLSPLLNALQARRVLAADLPLSTKADTKNKRYCITDPYLRFWLAFLQRGFPLIERAAVTWPWNALNSPGPPGGIVP